MKSKMKHQKLFSIVMFVYILLPAVPVLTSLGGESTYILNIPIQVTNNYSS
jgi:hypothetical protein